MKKIKDNFVYVLKNKNNNCTLCKLILHWELIWFVDLIIWSHDSNFHQSISIYNHSLIVDGVNPLKSKR